MFSIIFLPLSPRPAANVNNQPATRLLNRRVADSLHSFIHYVFSSAGLDPCVLVCWIALFILFRFRKHRRRCFQASYVSALLIFFFFHTWSGIQRHPTHVSISGLNASCYQLLTCLWAWVNPLQAAVKWHKHGVKLTTSPALLHWRRPHSHMDLFFFF